jgi:hypothetical protein
MHLISLCLVTSVNNHVRSTAQNNQYLNFMLLARRRLFETHLSPSDGLGPLEVVEWLGRVVDWFAVSELKLGNPNRTPRMDLRVGSGNFILIMLFLDRPYFHHRRSKRVPIGKCQWNFLERCT